MESGLDLGSVMVLEEWGRVGDVLGFKPALSSGVHEVFVFALMLMTNRLKLSIKV